MSRLKLRGDACRVQRGVVARISLQDLQRRLVVRILRNGRHGLANLAAEDRPRNAEILAIHRRHLDVEGQRRHLLRRRHHLVDRILLHRPRGVPARIGDFQLEHLVNLLAGLDLKHQRFAIGRQQSARAFVQRECHVEPRLVIGEDVIDSVDAVRRLLAARQRQHDIA